MKARWRGGGGEQPSERGQRRGIVVRYVHSTHASDIELRSDGHSIQVTVEKKESKKNKQVLS